MESASATRADLADRIDDLLPQTQCTQCGYAGCRPYAEAIAAGDAQINQCPPGGSGGIVKLATLLQRPVQPLNPRHGMERPLEVALIDESLCIGCTLCIQACPVDAIVGAARRMHTVIGAECTGCALCVAPCPMDCIAMEPAGREWTAQDAALSRRRHRQRQQRLIEAQNEQQRRLAGKALAKLAEIDQRSDLSVDEAQRKKAAVQAALARARARRDAANPTGGA
jgi:electron transport complex protein RnfB